jgi:hypothetical protein
LGIGVDHGVHLVHLWRQQRGRFVLGDATTVAVLLTASTTTASFGALILARHQGLQSLGQALTLGVTTCLAASIVFFPALLAWLTRNRPAEEVAAPATSGTSVPNVSEETRLQASETLAPQEPTTTPPQPVLTVVEPPPVSAPLPPAPVTAEEIAALLESAFSTLAPAVSPLVDEPVTGEGDTTSAIPRRRNLPRRNEAA